MSIGRPREFDTDQALEAAMHQFWRKGYEATSLQDLLEVMHLSKSSFYETFGNKHHLFEQCLTHYWDSLTSQMIEDLRRIRSGRKFIEAVFYAVADEASQKGEKHGCLLVTTANELAHRDKVIGNLVSRGTAKLAEVFLTAVKQAQQEGDLPLDKKPTLLAIYLVSSLSGLKTMVKGGADARTVKDIARVVLSALG